MRANIISTQRATSLSLSHTHTRQRHTHNALPRGQIVPHSLHYGEGSLLLPSHWGPPMGMALGVCRFPDSSSAAARCFRTRSWLWNLLYVWLHKP